MRRHIPLFLITFFSFFLISAMAESETGNHQFTVKDMLAMKRIGDPQVSPSGSKIVFSLREMNPDENRGITNLWKVAADGTGLVQLTNNSFSDFNPRWSSDGKVIYFLSARSGSSQVWRINT
ncbi:MAG: PD40 domain-containing protein, partial [Anaerolineales bacterium]|nr:PD40 domain-containing protein [Anaerolineales bacterium]